MAFHAEQADFEALQKMMDNEEMMRKKNHFLQPIYRDLKTIIKHMTYTEEFKLIKEYTFNRQLILDAVDFESEKAKDGLNALKTQYSKLLDNQRYKMKKNPGYCLEIMEKRLQSLLRLLDCWQKYIDVIYAPEVKINLMKVLQNQGDLSGNQDEDQAGMMGDG